MSFSAFRVFKASAEFKVARKHGACGSQASGWGSPKIVESAPLWLALLQREACITPEVWTQVSSVVLVVEPSKIVYSLYKILYPKRRIESYSIMGTIVSPHKILLKWNIGKAKLIVDDSAGARIR